MKTVRVTEQMAKRMLQWLEHSGLVEYADTLTVEDLMQKENTVTEQKTEQKRYATLIRIAVISEGASRDEVLDRLGTWAEGLVVEEVDNGDKGAVIDLHTTEVKEGESDSDVFSSYIGFPTLRSGRRE